MHLKDKITESAKYVSELINANPMICLLGGSNILDLSYIGSIHQKIQIQEIPHCEQIPVENSIVFYEATIENIPVILYSFSYRSVPMDMIQEVLYPIHILGRLGIRAILSFDAVETLTSKILIDDIVVISDHSNNTGINPVDQMMYHSDFIDKVQNCSEIYNESLTEICEKSALTLSIPFKRSNLMGIPFVEAMTTMERKLYSGKNSDVAGKIQPLEAIVARYYSMNVCSIMVSNKNNDSVDSTMLNERRQLWYSFLNDIIPKFYQYLASHSYVTY